MKKIGLVGGTSWTSTLDYYRYINEQTNKRLGGVHYGECMIYSVDFELFRTFNANHDWEATKKLLANAGQRLKAAGADILMLGANTSHIVAEQVSEMVGLPLVDIRVATALAVKAKSIRKVGLLGTVYTMELDFYKDRLVAEGLEVLIPETKQERDFIEDTLVHELGKGLLLPGTKDAYIAIINRLLDRGVEGIILGCTEIPLIIEQNDVAAPVFNTTLIHAIAAVELALTK